MKSIYIRTGNKKNKTLILSVIVMLLLIPASFKLDKRVENFEKRVYEITKVEPGRTWLKSLSTKKSNYYIVGEYNSRERTYVISDSANELSEGGVNYIINPIIILKIIYTSLLLIICFMCFKLLSPTLYYILGGILVVIIFL